VRAAETNAAATETARSGSAKGKQPRKLELLRQDAAAGVATKDGSRIGFADPGTKLGQELSTNCAGVLQGSRGSSPGDSFERTGSRRAPTAGGLAHHRDESKALRGAVGSSVEVTSFELLVRCCCGLSVLRRKGELVRALRAVASGVESCGGPLSPGRDVDVGRASTLSIRLLRGGL
jgi:hypothetical protein